MAIFLRLFLGFIFFVFLSFGCAHNEKALSKEPIRNPQLAGESRKDESRAAQTLEKERESKAFSPAPDFSLPDIYQDTYTLSSYKNKQPVLLLFWTTWCPFCRKELKVLNGLHAGLVVDGLVVLSIDAGEASDYVEDFVKDYNLAYRVLLDRDNRVAGSYEIMGVPTYILINKQGEIVFQDSYFPYKEYKDLVAE